MKTMIVKVEGQEHQLKVFVKEPLETFVAKMAKLVQQFAREVFWYMEAHPVLSEKYPEITNIAPRCYLARSDYDSDYK